MDLITPGFGLIFWQTLMFLGILLVLGKYAWKPIMEALRSREESIEAALRSAKKARKEMEDLKADNAKILDEARNEKANILKEATKMANDIKEKAQEDASKIGDKMIEDARAIINSEKEKALREIKGQVAELSLDIAEKLLKKNLEGDKAQNELIQGYIKDLKLN